MNGQSPALVAPRQKNLAVRGRWGEERPDEATAPGASQTQGSVIFISLHELVILKEI